MITSTIMTGENKVVKKACGVPTVDQEIPDVIILEDKLIDKLYRKKLYLFILLSNFYFKN